VRISEKQAKALGIDIGKAKRPKPAPSAAEVQRPKSGRSLRIEHPPASFEMVLDLPYDPQTKERPRTVVNAESLVGAFVEAKGNAKRFRELLKGRMSRTYTPKNTADYESLVRAAAMVEMAKARLQLFECPVETDLHFVFKGDGETWPTALGDGDADNLEKAVLDALNGVVFKDDRLVVRSTRSKSCGPVARLVVAVRNAAP
jgi:Holliday junction resolvase RusA-like endonuclease